MFVKMFVLFAVVAVSMVTANPLLQAIVSQTCPICEQNSLKNQIQNLLLQSVNNFQPYPQVYLNQNSQVQNQPFPDKRPCSMCQSQNINQNFQQPTNNFQPCQQQAINQPYCPCSPTCSQKTGQPQNNPAISGAVNQILSNPSLKTILDPNTKLYNQNGFEVPRNGACNAGTPQVVNNYIIVPPEFLLEDAKSASKPSRKINERSEERRTRKSKTDDRRTPRPNNNHGENIGRKLVSPGVALDGNIVNRRTSEDGERKLRRSQKNKNPDIVMKVINENKTQETNKKESPQTAKKEETIEISQKDTATIDTSTNDYKTIVVIPTPSLQNNEVMKTENNMNTSKIKTEDKKEQTTPTDKQKPEQKQILVPNTKETVHENPKQKKSQPSNKRVAKITSAPHINSREEAVINDFKKKFPNIPEEVVRNLLDYMNRQLSKQNLGVPPFYYPQFPINYDYLYRNQYAQGPTIAVSANSKKSNSNSKISSTTNQNSSSKNQSKNTRRRKNRRNKNRVRKPENITPPETCDTTVALHPTTEVTTTSGNEIETTTTSTTTTTEIPPTVEDVTEPTKVIIVSESIEEVHPIEITTPTVIEGLKPLENSDTEYKKENRIPELGTEDVVPTIYVNELDDEYYPDFTGDNQYYSYEDLSLVRLENDRYHYTTDKNFPLEELNRERRRFDVNSNTNSRRPPTRYIFRVKNKNRSRSSARPINENRRPKLRTTSSPLRTGFDINTVRPKVKVKVKADDFASKDFMRTVVAKNEEKPSDPEVEEIQFRTPPTLEKVDFETKQINKRVFFRDDVDFKTSSYSDAKTPQYEFNKSTDKSTNISTKQKPVDKIETVYARSKVVTYGKSASEDISLEKNIWEEEENNDRAQINNEDKTIVVAKSVMGDFW